MELRLRAETVTGEQAAPTPRPRVRVEVMARVRPMRRVRTVGVIGVVRPRPVKAWVREREEARRLGARACYAEAGTC